MDRSITDGTTATVRVMITTGATDDRGLPRMLVENVVRGWGEAGRRWLDELPRLLIEIADAWRLSVDPPYPLSFNYVCPAVRADGTPAVLKLGVPGSPLLEREMAALAVWNGRGAAQVLDHDTTRGALLLQRAVPGTRLRELVPGRDEEATAAIVAVLRDLHAAPVPGPGSPLPALETYRSAFAGHLGHDPDGRLLPRRWVQAADRLFAELCSDAPLRAVLHGDLHHDNVLVADDAPGGWLAIDPHGVVGDPGFEIAPVLYNPDPDHVDPDLLHLVPARVEQLADGLDLPLDRARAWGFVGCVLSAVWNCEDGAGPGGRELAVAELLAPAVLGPD